MNPSESPDLETFKSHPNLVFDITDPAVPQLLAKYASATSACEHCEAYQKEFPFRQSMVVLINHIFRTEIIYTVDKVWV